MPGELNIGGKFYIACESDGTTPDPNNTDLDASSFGALNWVLVPNMGQHGQTGVNQTPEGYESWDNVLTIMQKGTAQGEQPELRFLDEASNGLTAMKAAAGILFADNVAFKVEWNSGDIEYNRGLVSSLRYAKGPNNGWREAVFTLILNQEPVQA